MALEDDDGKNAAAENSTSNGLQQQQQQPKKKKRRRWGEAKDAAAAPAATTTSTTAPATMDPQAKIRAMQANIQSKLAAAKQKAAAGAASGTSTATSAAKALNIKERLAAAKAKQAASSLKRPAEDELHQQQKQAKKAKHYELDMSTTGPTFSKTTTTAASTTTASGGASTKRSKQKHKKQKKLVTNPYLAHQNEPDEDDNGNIKNEEEDFVDDRLQARSSQDRRRKKEIRFVEPGKWQEIAQRKRETMSNAQASGFLSGRKAGHSVSATSMGDVYGGGSAGGEDRLLEATEDYTLATLPPRYDAHPDTKMPLVMEWWDMELLPSRLRKQVAAAETAKNSNSRASQVVALGTTKTAKSKAATQQDKEDSNEASEQQQVNDDPVSKQKAMEELQLACFDKAALSYSKTAELVQHIVPIKPLSADGGPKKEPVLHLTKRELKRQRKLRRQEKQRELQDLQAAGLIPAPEPRLTLQNFIRVLGDQAYLDPSQMEKKVTEQIQARQQAHQDRNEASKLTKKQRAAKRARKQHEDTSRSVSVAIFWVADMSHPYHRAKVDLNAQQLEITGGVLECQRPALSCVIVEGGPKAIKRFIRLMTVRMKWTGPDDAEEQDDDDDDDNNDGDNDDTEAAATPKFNPKNKCELVWQGMAVKRLFSSFLFQACESADQARKVLKTKGVAHYWDQVIQRASSNVGGGQGSDKFQLKLGDDSDSEDDNPYAQKDEDEDIVMKDE